MMPNGGSRWAAIKKGNAIKAEVLGFRLVEFTYHALQRMKQRGVSESDILQAIRKPTKVGLPTEPGNEHIQWQKNRQTLINVVYTTKVDRVAIITTWKTQRPASKKKRRR